MNELTGKRILVVDDEEFLKDIMCDEFLAMGALPDGASDGVAALALAERNTYDVIISDVRMNGGDGLTLMRQVREKVRPVPKLFFCAGSNDVSAADFADLGIIAVFIKPFDWSIFTASIVSALRGQEP